MNEIYLNSQECAFAVLEEADLPPGVLLRFTGTASSDGAVSRNKRFYSPEFNTRAMEEANAYITRGGVITMFARHGRAVQPNSLATGIPCGRVLEFFRDGPRIRYRSELIDTEDGRDMAVAVKTKTMPGTSIRIHQPKGRQITLNGVRVTELTEGFYNGVDFAVEPGIEGAGVDAILEEYTIEEIEDMEWKDITLEELLENRKDLLEEYLLTLTQGDQAKYLDPAKKTALEESLAVASSALEESKYTLAVHEAAHILTTKKIFDEIMARKPKLEEISEVAVEVRSTAITEALANLGSTQTSQSTAQGVTDPPKTKKKPVGEDVDPADVTIEEAVQASGLRKETIEGVLGYLV
jgi:hypothetical protein